MEKIRIGGRSELEMFHQFVARHAVVFGNLLENLSERARLDRPMLRDNHVVLAVPNRYEVDMAAPLPDLSIAEPDKGGDKSVTRHVAR